MTDPDISIRRLIHRRPVPRELERALPVDLHPVLRRVFASRQVSPAELDVSLAAMIPVGRLPGAAEAADLLAAARSQQDHVMVLGDFDADGATATALMMTCLRGFGFTQVSYLVPDRFRYGYGLSPEIAELAAQQDPALIITVDNGISSREGIERCRRLGIKVIVTDHHLPGSELPLAQTIVNPNLPDSGFPSRNLCGVGVAFYVAAALGRQLADQGVIDAEEVRQVCADCLDLVALGTVADLVALDRNNRVLVAQGLRRIRAGRVRPGIQALFDCAGRQTADASTGDLAYAIAPRLNAAGRLTHMSLGIDCLLAGEALQAARLARRLDQLNAERRELQTRMQDQAERHLEALEEWMTGLRCQRTSHCFRARR
jgi:single-stranded-DNA-specific exonuclease